MVATPMGRTETHALSALILLGEPTVNDICLVCGEARAVHTHHRKLRSQGGGDEKSNLLRVCSDCHLAIHANPSESYARGLLVHSWADPALVEVFGAQAKLEALWAKQGQRAEEYGASLGDRDRTRGIIPNRDENRLTPGETCIVCKRRVPHPKKPSTPKSRVWSTRLPIDDGGADTFSELVDAAAEHHGLTSRPYHRYLVLLFGVTLLLQAQKGELPA